MPGMNDDTRNPGFPKGPAAQPGDKGWAERLADNYIGVKKYAYRALFTLVIKEAFMAGYAQRMIEEGAQLGNDDWPYFPAPWHSPNELLLCRRCELPESSHHGRAAEHEFEFPVISIECQNNDCKHCDETARRDGGFKKCEHNCHPIDDPLEDDPAANYQDGPCGDR